MELIRRVLFDGFPRHLAIPERFSVFTEAHFERALRTSQENGYNVYCSISRLPPTGPECDKLFFDLDAKAPQLEEYAEPEKFKLMRSDPDLAEDVLGGVVDDMQALAEASIEDDIPIVGIFSGMGIHVHQLYQEKHSPKREMKSTGLKYQEELGLETVDSRVFEPMRVTKIPNTHRLDDGRETGVWTIPLHGEEMQELDASDLLDLSRSPRNIDSHLGPEVINGSLRPEIEVHEEYFMPTSENVEAVEVGEPVTVDDGVEELVEEFIDLPCIRERVLSRDPDHIIRYNFAVMMFNYGFSRSELKDIIRRLGWKDFDPAKTDKQLDSIWRGKYSDMSCASLMREKYCTRTDNPKRCPAYGWSGGNQLY